MSRVFALVEVPQSYVDEVRRRMSSIDGFVNFFVSDTPGTLGLLFDVESSHVDSLRNRLSEKPLFLREFLVAPGQIDDIQDNVDRVTTKLQLISFGLQQNRLPESARQQAAESISEEIGETVAELLELDFHWIVQEVGANESQEVSSLSKALSSVFFNLSAAYNGHPEAKTALKDLSLDFGLVAETDKVARDRTSMFENLLQQLNEIDKERKIYIRVAKAEGYYGSFLRLLRYGEDSQ